MSHLELISYICDWLWLSMTAEETIDANCRQHQKDCIGEMFGDSGQIDDQAIMSIKYFNKYFLWGIDWALFYPKKNLPVCVL